MGTNKASKRISNIVQAIVHAKLANAACCYVLQAKSYQPHDIIINEVL